MAREYFDSIYKIIDLAKERDAVPSMITKDGNANKQKIISLSEMGEINPAYRKLDDDLYNYLQSLDYEVLEVAQVIMLIGRGDCACTRNNIIGEELYLKAKEELSDVIYKDSEGIITYITSKCYLGEYLEKGIEILNL